MKICPACRKMFKDQTVKCSKCNGWLIDPGNDWIIIKDGKYSGKLTTQQVKKKIKNFEISAYDIIFSSDKEKFVRLLELARFRTVFNRTGNWSIKIKNKVYYPLSKKQVIELIEKKNLKGNEKCYHPSVNEWRALKDFMEFGYKFKEEHRFCGYCGAKNTSSSVICWKCLKPLAKTGEEKIVDEKPLVHSKPVPAQKQSGYSEESREVRKTVSKSKNKKWLLLAPIILIIFALIYLGRAGYFNFNKNQGFNSNIVILDSRFIVSEKDYDDYSVKSYLISGKVTNKSSQSVKVIFLTGSLFNQNGEMVSSKTIQVYKPGPASRDGVFSYSDIKKGEKVPFKIYFYFHEMKKEIIKSWDVEVVKVLK